MTYTNEVSMPSKGELYTALCKEPPHGNGSLCALKTESVFSVFSIVVVEPAGMEPTVGAGCGAAWGSGFFTGGSGVAEPCVVGFDALALNTNHPVCSL